MSQSKMTTLYVIRWLSDRVEPHYSLEKPSRCSSFGSRFSSLLNQQLVNKGIANKYNVNVVNVTGNANQTEFRYTVSCEKSNHNTIIAELNNACSDKGLSDTLTQQKQPDLDESSSESEEGGQTTASAVPAKMKRRRRSWEEKK